MARGRITIRYKSLEELAKINDVNTFRTAALKVINEWNILSALAPSYALEILSALEKKSLRFRDEPIFVLLQAVLYQIAEQYDASWLHYCSARVQDPTLWQAYLYPVKFIEQQGSYEQRITALLMLQEIRQGLENPVKLPFTDQGLIEIATFFEKEDLWVREVNLASITEDVKQTGLSKEECHRQEEEYRRQVEEYRKQEAEYAKQAEARRLEAERRLAEERAREEQLRRQMERKQQRYESRAARVAAEYERLTTQNEVVPISSSFAVLLPKTKHAGMYRLFSGSGQHEQNLEQCKKKFGKR